MMIAKIRYQWGCRLEFRRAARLGPPPHAMAAAKSVADAAAKAAAEGVKTAKRLFNKVYFPNTIIELKNPIQVQEQTDPQKVVKFRVNPKLTKIEMRNWIEAMYDTPVKKVNTLNYEGKIQRLPGGKGYYKRPDYKIAYVYLENPWVPSQSSRKKS